MARGVRFGGLARAGPAAFHGTIYNLERKALLESAIGAGLVTQPPLPEIGSGFPRQFDVLQINSLNRVSLYDVAEPAWLDEYLVNLRRLRRRLNDSLDGGPADKATRR